MLNFNAVREKNMTMADLVKDLTVADLRALTNEMIDTHLDIIKDATDADVVFVPVDPSANDTFASSAQDVNIAWTLGHVVVHATASSEEGAALALNYARGLDIPGRSRYETPWESVTTIAQVRHRLEESRRMRLAMLDAWPDAPHYEVTFNVSWAPHYGTLNAIGRFVMGLSHEESHLDQLRDCVRQAKAARN